MKSIKRTLLLLKYNFKEIILFEIIYRFIASIAFLSIFSRGIEFAVKNSGYSYLTAKNIKNFLFKPISLLMIFIILIIGILFVLFETNTLLAAYQASERGEKLSIWSLFGRGILKIKYLFRKKNIPVIIIHLLTVMLMNYDFISRGVLHVKPMNDIVKNIKTIPWLYYSIIVLIIVTALLVIPYLFGIQACILTKKEGKEALNGSKRLVKKNIIWVILQIAILNIALLLFIRGILYGLTFLAAVIIANFVDRSITLALFLTTFDWLELGTLVLGSILSVVFNFAFLTGMYYFYRDKEDMEPERLISNEEDRMQNLKTRKTQKWIIAFSIFFIGIFLYDLVTNGIHYAKEVFIETQITAHRGSSKEAPENTIPAIELALEQMADFVEIDVQETKDGEIILLHDKSFKRTCGVNANPWNMTLEEIKQLDAGFYMGEQYIQTESTGMETSALKTPVPSLAEVLEICKDKINLNIELKGNGHDVNLVEKVVRLIEEYGMEQQCVFTSTNLKFLKEAKELAPEIKTGYIVSTVYGDFYKEIQSNESVDFFSANSGLLTERNVEIIHENGGEVHAWTVNSKSEIERMKRLGVDNIITDYPVLTREVLYREKDTESFIEFIKLVLK